MNRYKNMFLELKEKQEGAFIPFWVLGYPDVATSLQILETMIKQGADALELGIPFSDPIADGPTIQNASRIALENGMTPTLALQVISKIRARHPDIPIGLLLYANLVLGTSPEEFYTKAKTAGVDSILIADMPLKESASLLAIAKKTEMSQVMILPPEADEKTTKQVAEASQGYVYMLSRAGVTGADNDASMPMERHFQGLAKHNAAPAILGFGVNNPTLVANAITSGADGIICGSKLIDIYETGDRRLKAFIFAMKEATRKNTVKFALQD